jgi:antitoxin component YwqK of YwqJK toxin-antitoxin module
MKRIITISIFVLASTLGFAQYNHVQMAANGTIIEQGQYNADPGITANDSKQVIGQKMAVVFKTGSWKYWYDNGVVLAEETYSASGNRIGLWKTYNTNGTLASEINYTTGTAVFYSQSGVKVEEGSMNDQNERIGNWKGWFENGKVNYTGSYNTAGQKTGTWKFYDTNDQLIATENWVNGALSR